MSKTTCNCIVECLTEILIHFGEENLIVCHDIFTQRNARVLCQNSHSGLLLSISTSHASHVTNTKTRQLKAYLFAIQSVPTSPGVPVVTEMQMTTGAKVPNSFSFLRRPLFPHPVCSIRFSLSKIFLLLCYILLVGTISQFLVPCLREICKKNVGKDFMKILNLPPILPP